MMMGITIVKILGAVFKIPIGNILQDEGFGHFNNAYVIYNLLLMVSTAGLPLALSKTIAEADALDRRNQVNRTFQVALGAFLVLGVLTTVIMFAFAGPFTNLLGNGMAATAVRALAPACFFVCVISAFRGYAQGHANMVPTSVSQIIEAAVKVVVGIGLAVYFMRISAGTEVAAAGAIFGVTAGAGIALVYLFLDFARRKKREVETATDKPDSAKFILKRLMVIAIPITIGASIVPITTMLDTYQVQNILRDVMGLPPASFYQGIHFVLPDLEMIDPVIATYGSYQKAVTIFNLPSSFMVAITAAIIPAVSASIVHKDWNQARKVSESSLRISCLFAFPAGIGLTVLAGPVIRLLFFGTDYSTAVPCMAILGVASIFISLMFICNAVLQASGFVNLPIIVMAVGCVAKLLVNNYLVHQPDIGIVGAPIGTLVCYILVTALELVVIKRVIPKAPSYGRAFIKPFGAAAVMGVGAWLTSVLLGKVLVNIGAFQFVVEGTGEVILSRMGNAVVVMGTMLVAVVIYGALVLFLKAITKEDLSLMPKGDKIASFLRISS